MKIAYIDIKLENGNSCNYIDDILEYAAENSVKIDTAWNKEFFEDLYGPLNKYDGLIIHLGIENQRKLSEIIKDYPTLKIALISYAPHDYEDKDFPEEGKIKIFRSDDNKEIFDYFKN
jgi:hypothetical protein